MGKWQTAQDDEGRTYYYNTETSETSWVNPEMSNWVAYCTEDGKPYYHNDQTGETTWEKPEGFEDPLTEAQEDAMPEEADGDKSDVEKDDNVDHGVETGKESSGDSVTADEPAKTELDIELSKEPVGNLDDIISKSTEDAEAGFVELLRSKDIDSSWSFHAVMKQFITEPEYWAVEDASRRKQLYDNYLMEKMKQQVLNKTQVKETFENSFKDLLEKYQNAGHITSNTRWLSLKKRLDMEDNSVYKHSVLSDEEMAAVFYGIRNKLQADEETKLLKLKTQALTELETYLVEINPVLAQDDNLYENLNKDPRFLANKHFTVLDELDILTHYRTKIHPKVVEKMQKEISILEAGNYRQDRKARQEFRKLLLKIEIKATTEFGDILPLIENEDSFIEICGRNGSTPLDLFVDVVYEKSQSLKLKKDLVQSSLRQLNAEKLACIYESKEAFVLHLETSEEGFGGVDVNKEEMSEIYDWIMKEKHENKKRLQQQIEHRVSDLARWLATEYRFQEGSKLAIIKEGANDESGLNFVVIEGGTPRFRLPERQQDISVLSVHIKDARAYVELERVLHSTENETASVEEHLHRSVEQMVSLWNKDPSLAESKKRRAEVETEPKKKAKPVLLNY